MEILNVSNPVRTAVGGIDLILETKECGITPFHAVGTASADDDSYKLYHRAVAGAA